MEYRVLIVDDDPGTRRLLASLLAREYAVREAPSGEEAIQMVAAWQPDLVLLDLVMRGIDGHETCRRIKAMPLQLPPQVMVVSASALAEDMRLAFEAGADDYLVKPVRSCDLLSRAKIHTGLQSALKADTKPNRGDEAPVSSDCGAPSDDVLAIHDLVVLAMTKLAEVRDNETGTHLDRMRDYSTRLAEEARLTKKYLHVITDEFLTDIRRSAPLHDIGKVGIPDKVLSKPGRLTALEFDVMKQHTVIGAGMLERTAKQGNAGTSLRMAAEIARSHHERWDGSGYPDGLVGEQIPVAARIVAVADVFDALTSKRQYKPAWSAERARDYILEPAGTHFDPELAKCFEMCFPKIDRIHRHYIPLGATATEQRPPVLAMVAASQ